MHVLMRGEDDYKRSTDDQLRSRVRIMHFRPVRIEPESFPSGFQQAAGVGVWVVRNMHREPVLLHCDIG